MAKIQQFMIGILVFLFPLLALAQSTVLYQWTELGPNHQLIVRAVTENGQCPELSADNVIQHLTLRSKPTAAFPLAVCEGAVPVTTQHLRLNGKALPTLSSAVTRIAVIGDTGCRLKKGADPQACNNPQRWPFALIARQVAQWHPQLIIHVGDYLYRESACPKGNSKCAGSPFGDNWAAWQADFFHPAHPLFDAAPMLFIRGNHEICSRAGEGWDTLLNPFPYAPCKDFSPLYFVDVANTRLFILDSAMASDVGALNVAHYRDQLGDIEDHLVAHNWIVTHKPFWFIYKQDQVTGWVQSYLWNTLQAAWMQEHPQKIDLLLAGHFHRFQALSFSADIHRPPQIIVGNSGARLDPPLPHSNLAGEEVAGEVVQEGVSLNAFGFMTLEKLADNQWKMQLRNVQGKAMIECLLQGSTLNCHHP